MLKHSLLLRKYSANSQMQTTSIKALIYNIQTKDYRLREFEDLNSFLNSNSGPNSRQFYMIRDFPSGNELTIAPVSRDESIYGSEAYVALAGLKKNQGISQIIGVFSLPQDDPKVIDEVRARAKDIELRDAATIIFAS